MGFLSVEHKAGRQRALQFTQTSKSTLSAFVSPDLEGPLVNDSNFDLIALFQAKRINHGGG
jgi:hypothetical protein